MKNVGKHIYIKRRNYLVSEISYHTTKIFIKSC